MLIAIVYIIAGICIMHVLWRTDWMQPIVNMLAEEPKWKAVCIFAVDSVVVIPMVIVWVIKEIIRVIRK